MNAQQIVRRQPGLLGIGIDLEQLFSQAGEVQSATVITDKVSGQSKGFGFVEMASAGDAATAIERFNDTELKGRNIKVNEAKPRESSFGGGEPQWWQSQRWGVAAEAEPAAAATAGRMER